MQAFLILYCFTFQEMTLNRRLKLGLKKEKASASYKCHRVSWYANFNKGIM